MAVFIAIFLLFWPVPLETLGCEEHLKKVDKARWRVCICFLSTTSVRQNTAGTACSTQARVIASFSAFFLSPGIHSPTKFYDKAWVQREGIRLGSGWTASAFHKMCPGCNAADIARSTQARAIIRENPPFFALVSLHIFLGIEGTK
jgi:hypothetical protein